MAFFNDVRAVFMVDAIALIFHTHHYKATVCISDFCFSAERVFFGKPPNYVFTRTPLIQPCLSVKWMMLIQKLVLLEKFLQAENERQMVEISRSATILHSDDSE